MGSYNNTAGVPISVERPLLFQALINRHWGLVDLPSSNRRIDQTTRSDMSAILRTLSTPFLLPYGKSARFLEQRNVHKPAYPTKLTPGMLVLSAVNAE